MQKGWWQPETFIYGSGRDESRPYTPEFVGAPFMAPSCARALAKKGRPEGRPLTVTISVSYTYQALKRSCWYHSTERCDSFDRNC